MSSHLFLYFGLGLIFLAVIFLPAKVRFVVQPEIGETELWHIGPIFTLLIGVWSLPSLLLGTIEFTTSKRAALPAAALILFLANGILAGLIWDAARFWRSMLIQWLINYSPFIIPCLIADAIAFFYFARTGKFVSIFKNLKVRIPLIIVLMVTPLLLATALLYMWFAATS